MNSITVDALRNHPSDYGTLIDVRSPAEFAVGHIPGAINVPMEQVEVRMADIGNGPAVLICEAGTRASIVAGWLAARQPVSVLAGGTAAWRKNREPKRCNPSQRAP